MQQRGLPARGLASALDIQRVSRDSHVMNEQKNASWRRAGAAATEAAQMKLGWTTWF